MHKSPLLRTHLPRLVALAVGIPFVVGFCSVAARSSAQAPVSFDVRAPELVGGPWLNTPKNEAIKLAARKGKVTIVEFWTFG